MNREKFQKWPGPMEGVMTPDFLRAAGTMQLAGRWMTPFWRVTQTLPRERFFEEFLAPWRQLPGEVTVQLMGCDRVNLCRSAERFIALGAAGINLNCGCPSRQVTSDGVGGGALRDFSRTLELLRALRQCVTTVPLSVKLRTGWSDPAEAEKNLPELQKLGIDQVFLHYRTVQEQYRPAAGRQERLTRARQLLDRTKLIVNGDFDSVEAFHIAEEKLLADGVMSARGWLRDPYLLKRGPGKKLPAPEAAREQFFDAVLSSGVRISKAIELALLLWGKDNNPRFEYLKTLPFNRSVTAVPAL